MRSVADIIVQGILLGGLYALFATGLSLVFGVMRLVNLAHGDFIVVAAFAAFCVVSALPVHPFVAILAVVPFMAGLGYLLQIGLFNRLLGNNPLRSLLVTFGVSVILQNMLLMIFSADTRRLSAGSIETQSVDVGAVAIGVYPVVVFAIALAVTMTLQWVFYSTSLGQRLRATSDDPEIVGLVGINHLRVFASSYTDAWCSRDPARVAEHYASGGSLAINGGDAAVGRSALAEVAQSFMSAFPDLQVLMDDVVVRDDGRVEYHWTLVGTNTGPGGTGNRVRISGFEEWTIGADGLIAGSQGHYDQAEYDRQLAHRRDA